MKTTVGFHIMPGEGSDVERHFAPSQTYTNEYLEELRDVYDIYYTGLGVHAFKVIPMGKQRLIQLFKEDDGQLIGTDVRFEASWADELIQNLKYAVESTK